MEPEELFDDWLEGTVHRDRQVDPRGVHLTVAGIDHAHTKGEVDFGGSEMKPAVSRAVTVTLHSPGDKFAWWRLEPGTYIVKFNEKLKPGAPPMLLTGNERVLACGCTVAATVVSEGELSSVLTVPDVGVNVKQNARVALLRPLG
jgi:hypothetical protein